jgi:hypothetical protein
MNKFTCVFALAATIPLGGCNKREPKESLYFVETKDLGYVGATVVAQGVRATLDLKTGSGTPTAQATLRLPASAPPVGQELQLELQTPCGEKLVSVRTDLTAEKEQRARQDGSASYVKIDAPPPAPLSIFAWVDGTEPAKLGDAELRAGGMTAVFDPACKATVPVTMSGKEVGSYSYVPPKPLPFKPSLPRHAGVFVTGQKDACYTLTSVSYSNRSDNQSFARKLKDAQVYPLDQGDADIRYFLTPAPSSGSDSVVMELVKGNCR